jgi:Flp pilus assembly protein TadD
VGGIGVGIASANDRNDPRIAAVEAAAAGKALAHHQATAAVAAAEAAVGHAAHNAGYRLLLGQSYLAAGRFVSARAAFADVLVLTPGNGKAALDLALMQIATGDWAGGRRTLDQHSATVAPSDRGLATALAGDPAGAATMLTPLARSAEATPKLRQNLALSLALAGQWSAARAVAAVDLSPADLDARMEQWAAFARPQGAADQVAMLLGIHPVADAGEPAQLALDARPSIGIAAASAPAPVVAPAVPLLAAATTGSAAGAARIVFAAPHEVVQALPVLHEPMAASEGARYAAARSGGTFFVQLGAFRSAAAAYDAWNRARRRLPVLAARGASGMRFPIKGAAFYRLSVGGFARREADALCRRYREAGGACFVRAGAGDQMASWTRERPDRG